MEHNESKWNERQHGGFLLGNTFKRIMTLVAIAVAGSRCGAGAGAARAPGEPVTIGRVVPDLELAALDGAGDVRFKQLRGKVVLLDLWASWCVPCQQELPMLDEMAGRLRDRDIEIVAVSVDEKRADAEAFLKSRANWSLRLAHDPEGKLPADLQPTKMPSSYLVGRDGVIHEVIAGFDRRDTAIERKLVDLASRQ